MLFHAHNFVAAHRRVRPLISDGRAKAILSRARILLHDAGVPVEGRIIGWKTTDAGTTGAIVANPLTGSRHLYAVDFATGRPLHLKRLA